MQEETIEKKEAVLSETVTPVEGKAPEKSRILPLPEKREPELEEMLKAGVHFGHQKGRWDPKMKSFIYGERGGVHIIDLQKSLEKFKLALDEVKKIAASGGKIVFVGTKKQARKLVREAAELTGMPYVTERWLGGTFTNFATISKRIQKLSELETQEKEEKLGTYTKKERIHFRKQIADFTKNMKQLIAEAGIPADELYPQSLGNDVWIRVLNRDHLSEIDNLLQDAQAKYGLKILKQLRR